MSLARVLLAFVLVGVAAALYFDAGSSGIKVVITPTKGDVGQFSAKTPKGKNKALAFFVKNEVMYRGLAAVAMAYKLGCLVKRKKTGEVGACKKVTFQYLEVASRKPLPERPAQSTVSPSDFVLEALGFAGAAGITTTQKIPILATAGMRPPEVPQDMWTSTDPKVGICVEVKNGNTVPKSWTVPGPKGSITYTVDNTNCRVLAGPEEAWLEYMGQKYSGLAPGTTDARGTVTMGGASAQISIQLRDELEVEHWRSLMRNINKTNGVDPNSSPVFVRGTHPRKPIQDEVLNYIDIRLPGDVAGWGTGGIAPITTGIEGVGLLSFLAVANREANPNIGGRNVFGGSDALEAILIGKGFGDDRCNNFLDCHKLVTRLFHRDPLFHLVAPIFRRYFSDNPVMLAGGMDVARTIVMKNVNGNTVPKDEGQGGLDARMAVECSSPTGILGAVELEKCLRVVFIVLSVRCADARQLQATDPENGNTNYCLTALARFVVTDALWGNNATRIYNLGHGPNNDFISVDKVDIKFGTKSWPAQGPKPFVQAETDPADGFVKIGTFNALRKRSVEVRKRKNRRHL